MCGEKFCAIRPQVVQAGSPPRVRGKVNRSAKLLAADGITPACAGKRTRHAVKRHWSRDHPRVCGEKRKRHEPQQRTAGSPPRVRGKVSVDEVNVFHGGITPACAGKRRGALCTHSCAQDHPRVCGEKARTLIEQNEPQGSPPRVRGKERASTQTWQTAGITPACAGKRRRCSRERISAWDHPRVCGEKPKKVFSSFAITGSPPRVRGKEQ